MKKTTCNEQTVRRYFDAIAAGYPSRYSSDRKYHAYFFRERLDAATKGLDFEDKAILDIGAGTGALYELLVITTSRFTYFATDISANMLAASNIPESMRFCGKITRAPLPRPTYDYIFLLGVTTYMSRSEWTRTLAFLSDRLSPGGKLIVSFTNRCSWDYRLRLLLKKLKIVRAARHKVIGQSFQIQAYCPQEIEKLSNVWHCTPPVWLNQTFTPFNHLLPDASVRLAKWLKVIMPDRALLYLSGDFLVGMVKVES